MTDIDIGYNLDASGYLAGVDQLIEQANARLQQSIGGGHHQLPPGCQQGADADHPGPGDHRRDGPCWPSRPHRPSRRCPGWPPPPR